MIHRVYKPRKPGIPKHSHAPFWRGERAEDIVASRVKEYSKQRKIAVLKRRRKRKSSKK